MYRYLITACLIYLCLYAGNASCEELSKCDHSLEYIYNYYYDPEALKINRERPIGSDTTSESVTAADSTSSVDSSASHNVTSPDSFVTDSQRTEIIAGKALILDSVSSISPRSIVDLTGFDPLDNPSLYFVEGVPYLSVFMQITGDGSDLNALGVDMTLIIAGRLVADFPLSILPQVNALQTVIKIRSSAKVELNSIDSNESSNMSALDVSIQNIGADKVHQIETNGSVAVNDPGGLHFDAYL